MRTLKHIFVISVLLGAPLLFSSCGGNAVEATTESGDHIYRCPMHPEITGKEGDKCSKCGMPLEHTDIASAKYACPMHPDVTGKMGDKCSKCGMPLEHTDIASAKYACPMHPDVTGKMGDKCSKCGMPLEAVKDEVGGMDHGAMSGGYKMELALEPAMPVMDKPAVLKFTPVKLGQEGAPVPLDVVHEKKLHLIVVSSDLSMFDHVHPEYQTDGSYTLTHSFPEGGDFLLYADYAPTGGGKQLERISVKVDGPVLPTKTIDKEQRTGKVDGYEVRIDPQAVLSSGSLQHFTAEVYKGGKKVDANEFENYLGAKAHVVVIGAQNKDYLHVHPEVENGAMDLHATFATPGFYKGWFQFQTGGKVHTAELILEVKQGEAGDGHADHDHGTQKEEHQH